MYLLLHLCISRCRPGPAAPVPASAPIAASRQNDPGAVCHWAISPYRPAANSRARNAGPVSAGGTIAQYRALVVLASRGPQRMTDLAGALDVAPSTAGRMCDRLVRKGLIRRHRARADRRAVLVSVTAAGRLVVDQATARRRALIGDILARLPADTQRAVAGALAAFADAAGEVPDSQWPSPGPAKEPR
jgi:DNA-binding MarR family transcriptional regulator